MNSISPYNSRFLNKKHPTHTTQVSTTFPRVIFYVLCLELEEDSCGPSSDCVLEGVTFYAAYLGSALVDQPSGEDTTAEAVRTIVTMAKKLDRKLGRVALTVSLRGIRVEDCNTGDTHLEFSIYRSAILTLYVD